MSAAVPATPIPLRDRRVESYGDITRRYID